MEKEETVVVKYGVGVGGGGGEGGGGEEVVVTSMVDVAG